MMNRNDKDKMHPEDMRNLIIFGILSIVLWLLYDAYVIQPQKHALDKARKAQQELQLKNPELYKPKSFQTATEVLGQSQRIRFENDEMRGSIPLTGGMIDDLSLKHYYETLSKEDNVKLFTPQNTKGARYVNYGWVSGDKTLNLPNAATQWRVRDNDVLRPDLPVTLYWDNGQGIRFERILSLDNNYVFAIKQRIINNSGRVISVYPFALVSQTGVPQDYNNLWIYHEGPMGYLGEEMEQMDYGAMDKTPDKKQLANKGWIGFSDKYWLTALIPQQGVETKFRFKQTEHATQKERTTYQTDYTAAETSVANGNAVEYSYHLYAGAKKVLKLEAYQEELNVPNLDLAVDFGWFWFFTYPFFLALHYLGLLVGNMGVAIIILTIIIRGSVFPLTNASYKSFAKMKVVAPQIAELKEKYSDDKQKLQSEIVELYQREGVNPMSGCLPILVQIPIFFAFYKILLITIEIRHAPFFGWIQDLSARDPTSVFNLFGLLPWTPPEFMMIGVWPCCMLIAMLLQKKLNPPPQDKLQRDMMNIFPFFITFIMAGFASGLVVYWTFSAVIGIIQQTIIMRSMGVPIYIFEKDKFAQDLEKGPDVHPLVEMVEEETEKALFGDGGDEPETPPEIKAPKPKKKKKKK